MVITPLPSFSGLLETAARKDVLFPKARPELAIFKKLQELM